MSKDQQLTCEAIDAVAKLAIATVREPFITYPGEPAHIIHVLNADGTYSKSLKEPLRACPVLPTVDAFVKYVKENCTVQGEDDKDVPTGAVFFNEKELRYVLDPQQDWGDGAVCPLTKSDQLLLLEKLEDKNLIDQKSLIRLLRINFHGCVDSSIIPTIRHIVWTARGDVDSEVTRHNVGLKKSVREEAMGFKDLPDELIFTIPMFKNHRVTKEIRCDFDTRPEEQKFSVCPFATELVRAVENTMLDLRGILEREFKGLLEVYYGQFETTTGG
jgi:hypothetical protein